MKNNRIQFAVTATILTIFFRYALSFGIDKKSNLIVIISALTYGIAMYFSGKFFGKREKVRLPFYDVGFWSHLTTYLIYVVISEFWFVLNCNSKFEKITVIHLTAIIWGFFIIVHFLYFLASRKNAIRNLNKKDLFE
jgi:hypothetical protein